MQQENEKKHVCWWCSTLLTAEVKIVLGHTRLVSLQKTTMCLRKQYIQRIFTQSRHHLLALKCASDSPAPMALEVVCRQRGCQQKLSKEPISKRSHLCCGYHQHYRFEVLKTFISWYETIRFVGACWQVMRNWSKNKVNKAINESGQLISWCVCANSSTSLKDGDDQTAKASALVFGKMRWSRQPGQTINHADRVKQQQQKSRLKSRKAKLYMFRRVEATRWAINSGPLDLHRPEQSGRLANANRYDLWR